MLCGNALHSMSGATEFSSFFDDQRREAILNALIEGFYPEDRSAACVFDTNRSWTARASLIDKIRPTSRIICCVREVGWILDSIERLVRRNALQPSRLFGFKAGGSVYSRVEALMEPDKGLVGSAWSSLREAWFGEHADKLIVLSYERLVRNPREVMLRLYHELDEPEFAHDFTNVNFKEPLYDSDLGLPGLHQIRSSVAHVKRDACIPPDIFSKFSDVNFWMNEKLNTRSVYML